MKYMTYKTLSPNYKVISLSVKYFILYYLEEHFKMFININ